MTEQARRRKPRVSWLGVPIRDVCHAVRTLRKSPGYTLVAVLTLALGIGGTTAIFSVANLVLLRPLPGVESPDDLVAIYTSDFSSGPYGGSSYPDYLDYREQTTAFSSLAAFTGFTLDANFSAGGEIERIEVGLASGNYFSTLGVEATLGRTLLPVDEESPGPAPVAVLSHSLWQQRFGGDPEAIGSTLRLNGRAFTVAGVAPAGFYGTQLAAVPDVWLPLSATGFMFGDARMLEQRDTRWLGMVGRLAPDATMAQANAQIETLTAQLAEAYPETNLGTLQAPDAPRPMALVPAGEAMVDPDARDDVVSIAWLLGGAALLVLLIGCANLANLELARATSRVHEVALRLSLGAAGHRVLTELVITSVLLALIGGSAGFLFALTLADLILASDFAALLIANDAVPASALDQRALIFAFLLSLGAGVSFGLVPALRASRTEPMAALKRGGSRSATRRGRTRLQNTLVVSQVALALLLLVCAGLFVESLRRTLAVDPGFTLQRGLIASIDLGNTDYDETESLRFLDALKERIESQPQVTSVAYAQLVPVDPTGMRRWVSIDGYVPQPGEDMEVNLNRVGRDYFRTMGIALLGGRGFLATDGASSRSVAVVNETFASRYFGGADPVGRVIRYGGPDGDPIRIVGMAQDGKYRSLREAPLPYVYLPLSQSFSPNVSMITGTTDEPMSVAAQVRAEVRRLDPDVPLFAVQSLRQHLGTLVAMERTVGRLVAVFGVVAMLLATLGIYGLMTFLVVQRTREIGIRMALGARGRSVLRFVLGRGALLTGLGLSLGLGAALALTRALSSMLYGIGTVEPAIFVSTVLLLLTAAALASYFPARRATTVDPATILRTE